TGESTVNTVDGIQYEFEQWGAIAQFMGPYYPSNISWPNTDPSFDASQANSAAWWWAQAHNASSPYYDPEVAACTTANPCEFPAFSQTGAPTDDELFALWTASVTKATGGAVKMDPLDINFIDLVINSLYGTAYHNPMPLYTLAWAPDYPDPTDYFKPLYEPDATYTYSDTVAEQLIDAGQGSQNPFWAASCHTSGAPTVTTSNGAVTAANLSDLIYWANYVKANYGIPTACQGAAYNEMVGAMATAIGTPAGTVRQLMYNLIVQIESGLVLYTYQGQSNEVVSYSTWINPASINDSVMFGGGSDQLWYNINGSGVL
ncbi:MAG: hypothetical protein WA761_10300, partial [Thermoplasmata archaeon]